MIIFESAKFLHKKPNSSIVKKHRSAQKKNTTNMSNKIEPCLKGYGVFIFVGER